MNASSSSPSLMIGFRSGKRRLIVDLRQIHRIQASNNRSLVFTAREPLVVDESLGAVLERLPADQFMRVSRSHVVNKHWVASLKPCLHGDQTLFLRNGAEVRLSRTRRAECMRWLGLE
ncbi:MAG: LytTR family transcriptional regulator DNA-binding domain-containing protein [Verrucomicrobia bacterium]|nr:LytTR family transcriptional regulator DNA-binding domain-containing protein [Verrucomicrobiota bacterium]MBI3866917.1 LytTR family transcriptional regulator DNA-binding domain-containing protein [Verrucomicrobiota bacterium]